MKLFLIQKYSKEFKQQADVTILKTSVDKATIEKRWKYNIGIYVYYVQCWLLRARLGVQ